MADNYSGQDNHRRTSRPQNARVAGGRSGGFKRRAEGERPIKPYKKMEARAASTGNSDGGFKDKPSGPFGKPAGGFRGKPKFFGKGGFFSKKPRPPQPWDLMRLKQSLQKAIEKRRAYVGDLQAYRLAGRDELKLPISIDKYLNKAVVQIYSENGWKELSEAKQAFEALVQELSGCDEFHYKMRYVAVKGMLEGDQAIKSGEKASEEEVISHEFVLEENGGKFLINLQDYLDTGLFLDHREARKLIGKMAKGLVVGNLFAYTGSFSVYAGLGGALKTYTVDLSRKYCEWARRNLELNGLPKDNHWVINMESFEFITYAGKKGLKFDILVIDPPTFSRNKESNFSVLRDHNKLLKAAAELLVPGGYIFFSNNCLDFKMSPDLWTTYEISNLTDKTIPLDFKDSKSSRDPHSQIHHSFLLKKRKGLK
ncbi:MAG: class I SAM-dependent rRNA methyltransferase [Candidatus Altimarinota bacterium]